MLNFIVLGYVPGTSLQLSFADVFIGGLVLLGLPLLVWYGLRHSVRQQARRIVAIELIAL